MIKIFINCSKMGREYRKMFELKAKKKKIEASVQSKAEEDLTEIPRGFDIYLIHFSDILDEEEPARLREEQPWSEIHYVFGGNYGSPEEHKGCGTFHYIVHPEELEEMLENAQNNLNSRIKIR